MLLTGFDSSFLLGSGECGWALHSHHLPLYSWLKIRFISQRMEGWRAERTFLSNTDTHLWGNICALLALSSFRNYSSRLWNKSLLSPQEMGIVWVALHKPGHLFPLELLEWQQCPQAAVGGCEAGREEGMDVRAVPSRALHFPGLVYPSGFLICLFFDRK